ncbi:endoglucanase E-4-like [Haliotis rufescens]|uniref:endoglucanase E-4-like n=1 Tax=Haliotis rufescens TaxID=6454 RepID=UPI00201EB84A|nr:endoglucanase E-4-like [Haliotis rufescens]
MLPLILLLVASGATGDDQSTKFELMQHWDNNFEGKFCFKLATASVGWELDITFNVPVQGIQQWDGDFIHGSNSGCSDKYAMVNKGSKGIHAAGDSVCVRMMGKTCGSGGAPTGTGILKDLSNDHQTLPKIPHVAGAQSTKYNYAEVLMKSILFYEAQRSGKLPASNRIPWRADSALGDKGASGEYLTGGWYDAGDNVKFNFPMAWSTTVLTWGLLMYKDAYVKSGQLDWMYQSIKWPLDYFIKCHTKPNELYVQVGDGGIDHGSWTSPERMTGKRPSFKISASCPGSDIAMETAAAMAAGSIAFKQKGDTAYASTLLTHAKQLFEFGKAYPGKYSDCVSAAAAYYKSQDDEDEFSWGGMWLYKATGDQTYLDFAEKHFVNKTAWGFSWDEKIGGANMLLYIETKKDIYKKTIVGTFQDWFPGGSVTYSPKCLAFRLQWGALRYASNTALLALVAADAGIDPVNNRKWAMSQINYALGDAGRSYVIGFGTNPPRRPHHRAASCPSLPAPCGWDEQQMKVPDPHTLYGAMVGGPGKSDGYVDDRGDYVKNEVACDYNAGFQSAVAGLEHLAIAKELPSTYKDVCP